MIELPRDADGIPVIRTDVSDDAAWELIWDAIGAEDYAGSGYVPRLSSVVRSDLAALEVDALVERIPTQYPSGYDQPFVIVIDAVAVASPEHPVLLVDLNEDDAAAPFRALPREIAAIEANLSIATMDFAEFGENIDSDGVFRGFAGADDGKQSEPDAVDVEDEGAATRRREDCDAAGRAIYASLEDGAPALSGLTGTVRIRASLPRPARRLYPLIKNLDITNMSAPNEPVVGNEFRMSSYLVEEDGFVGPRGQIQCRWTELVAPTRVAMTWAWMRTLPDADVEDRLPQRATLTVDLAVATDDSTILELVHDTIPAEWVEHMTAVWRSKIDQWVYQSRPKRGGARS